MIDYAATGVMPSAKPAKGVVADQPSMASFDPNLGLGKQGYAKAIQNHIATLNSHLSSVGMTAASPGAKQVADGIHKAAMDQMFNPRGELAAAPGSNANSTRMMAAPGRGTSDGRMVR